MSKKATAKAAKTNRRRNVAAKVKRFWRTKRGKVTVVSVVLLTLLVVLLAVPIVRDQTFGRVVKKDVTLAVVDSRSGEPVSGAVVSADGKSTETNADGIATLTLASTEQTFQIAKPNYESTDLTYRIPFFTGPEQQSTQLKATGKPVSVSVINAITKSPVKAVAITSGNVKSVTDDEGVATVVLAYQDDKHTLSLQADGYNKSSKKYDTSSKSDKITVAMVPSGRVQFIRQDRQNYNVVQTNLDGSGQKVLDSFSRQYWYGSFLSSRDWAYSALIRKTEGEDTQQLTMYNAKSGAKTVIREGKDLQISPIGWSDNNTYVYKVIKTDDDDWENQQAAIYAYNPESKQSTILDQTTKTKPEGERITVREFYRLNKLTTDGELIVVKSWSWSGRPWRSVVKDTQVLAINPSTTTKTVVGTIPTSIDRWVGAVYQDDNETLYLRKPLDSIREKYDYYEYTGGKLTKINDFSQDDYDAFDVKQVGRISPDKRLLLWSETLNQQTSLYLANIDGSREKQIASDTDYRPYGWYGSEGQYILLNAENGELSIADPAKLKSSSYKPLSLGAVDARWYYYPGEDAFAEGYGRA